MKVDLTAYLIAAGAYAAAALGGWDVGLQSLLVLMAADYVSGLLVAGVFKRSNKSESGELSSACGWKGLAKKGMMLLVVLVAYRVDLMAGMDVVRSVVVIGFMANEALSIIENAGLMGVPVPEKMRKAIDILHNKKQG